jgi:hypothetical protein
MRARLVVIAVAFVALLGVFVLRASAVDPPAPSWVMGTARPTGAAGSPWELIGGAHISRNLGAPTCNAGTGVLTVPYLSALISVGTSSVTTDETWSRDGIVVGASIGLTFSALYFTKMTADGPVPVSCAALTSAGNVWVLVAGT